MKPISPQTRIVGCWPENSRVMYECLQAGKVVDFPEQPTLSESTAGGVEPGSITFELCQRVIDHGVLVSEAEILDAMRWAYRHDWKIEGAAAVAIAAFFREASRHDNKTVAIISCGGNTSPEVLAQTVARGTTRPVPPGTLCAVRVFRLLPECASRHSRRDARRCVSGRRRSAK